MNDNTEEFEGGASGKSSISSDLIRGHINTIILRSLYDRDKYGYEIISEINEKSHGQYTLKQPTLYSALKRLENQGYIQAYWKNDEVSSGGRRKYFRLTKSGREITEQNLAEWEYSRTVIDNLISDRNFDFSQPAPTPVDFKILKQATSRVPVVHGEGEEQSHAEHADERPAPAAAQAAPTVEARTYTVSEDEQTIYIDDPTKPAESDEENSPKVVYSSETEKPLSYSEQVFESGIKSGSDADEASQNSAAEEPAAEEKHDAEGAEPVQESQISDSGHTNESPTESYPDDAPFAPDQIEAEKARYTSQLHEIDEETRRQLHENYLKLISDDDGRDATYDEQPYYEPPYSDSYGSNDLIYNARPEQERDYKNLIDKLFDNTLQNTDPTISQAQSQAQQPQGIYPPEPMQEQVSEQPAPAPQPIKYNGYAEVSKRAASDGIKISTSEEAFAAGSVKQTTYNKGATLFKCSLIVGVIMLLEFIITFVLRDSLGVSIAYPIVILAIGLATVLVCGILYGARYGNHMRKPTSLKYIITACVITVLLIVIIIIFGVIIQTNWTSTAEVLANIVIPCIIALNIPVFTLSFYLFTKN